MTHYRRPVWRHSKKALQELGWLGVQLQLAQVQNVNDFSSSFEAMPKAQAESFVILGSPLFTNNTRQLAALAIKHRMPGIYYNRRFAEAGGLMAYGPDESDPSWGYRRAAVYVDKILKGTKPAIFRSSSPPDLNSSST